MIDEASAEDIRIAKQHLERALARAINRDSLRWANPPTYVVTDNVPSGTYYGGFDPEAFVDLDEPAEIRPKWVASEGSWEIPEGDKIVEPDVLEWRSLDHVPVGVVVRDKAGDFWKIKPNGKLRIRFHGEKKWHKANVAGAPLSGWDHFAPFTEVKDR
jgi:hypothetical protein